MTHVLLSLLIAGVALTAVPLVLSALAALSMCRQYRRALKDSHYGH